jgi:hypothetical protein
MGVVIVGELFSLGINLFIILALYFMWSKAKKSTIQNLNIEEYENEQVK